MHFFVKSMAKNVELLCDRRVRQIFSDEFLCDRDSKRVPEIVFQYESKYVIILVHFVRSEMVSPDIFTIFFVVILPKRSTVLCIHLCTEQSFSALVKKRCARARALPKKVRSRSRSPFWNFFRSRSHSWLTSGAHFSRSSEVKEKYFSLVKSF